MIAIAPQLGAAPPLEYEGVVFHVQYYPMPIHEWLAYDDRVGADFRNEHWSGRRDVVLDRQRRVDGVGNERGWSSIKG